MQPYIQLEQIPKVISTEYHPSIPDAEECRRRTELLSFRQTQMLTMMAGGYSTKQAAYKLGIAHKTATNHVDRAMALLDVRPAVAAVAAFRRAQEAPRALVAVEPDPEPEGPTDEPLGPSEAWYWRIGGRQSPTAWAATDSGSEDGKDFKVVS